MTTLFTGTPLLGRPSWGAWVSYALGTANKNLPEFVVLSKMAKAGAVSVFFAYVFAVAIIGGTLAHVIAG